MATGAAFDAYLNGQLSDPAFRHGFDRKLGHLNSFVTLMQAMERARAAGNLTKKDVADRMGKHPSAVSRLLCGDGANPTLETIAELADALDLTISVEVKPRSKRAKKREPAVAVKSYV